MIAIQPDPSQYSQQLADKLGALQAAFSQFQLPEVQVFSSPPLYFRHRADFAVWHEGNNSHFAVFPDGRAQGPTYVDQFPIASQRINELMTKLLPAIENSELLRKRLFQTNFHTSLSNQAMITLAYHKPLDEQWRVEAQQLADDLNINLIGRSRKQKIVIGNDYITEVFDVGKRQYHYQQLEGCFTQSNPTICQAMLNWVDSVLARQSNDNSDLLELYCGNGNFTLPMAKYFRRVLATELVRNLTNSAQQNCDTNGIDNIDIVRLSAEEVVEAIDKVRQFRRLRDIDLEDYQLTTLFVDPPRAGLDPACRALAQKFDQVIYISCNPQALLEDLQQLTSTHDIVEFAVFDQFPYTHHLECGISLNKR